MSTAVSPRRYAIDPGEVLPASYRLVRHTRRTGRYARVSDHATLGEALAAKDAAEQERMGESHTDATWPTYKVASAYPDGTTKIVQPAMTSVFAGNRYGDTGGYHDRRGRYLEHHTSRGYRSESPDHASRAFGSPHRKADLLFAGLADMTKGHPAGKVAPVAEFRAKALEDNSLVPYYVLADMLEEGQDRPDWGDADSLAARLRQLLPRHGGGNTSDAAPEQYARGDAQEQSFHAALMANPEEKHNALVYADWLDEQGAPATAEVIRGHAKSWRDAVGLHDTTDAIPAKGWRADIANWSSNPRWVVLETWPGLGNHRMSWTARFPEDQAGDIIGRLRSEGVKTTGRVDQEFPSEPGPTQHARRYARPVIGHHELLEAKAANRPNLFWHYGRQVAQAGHQAKGALIKELARRGQTPTLASDLGRPTAGKSSFQIFDLPGGRGVTVSLHEPLSVAEPASGSPQGFHYALGGLTPEQAHRWGMALTNEGHQPDSHTVQWLSDFGKPKRAVPPPRFVAKIDPQAQIKTNKLPKQTARAGSPRRYADFLYSKNPEGLDAWHHINPMGNGLEYHSDRQDSHAKNKWQVVAYRPRKRWQGRWYWEPEHYRIVKGNVPEKTIEEMDEAGHFPPQAGGFEEPLSPIEVKVHEAALAGKLHELMPKAEEADFRPDTTTPEDFYAMGRRGQPRRPEQMARKPHRMARVPLGQVHEDFRPTGLAPRVGRVLGDLAAEHEPGGPQPLHAAVAELALTTGEPQTLGVLADVLDESDHPAARVFNWRGVPRGMAVDRLVEPYIRAAIRSAGRRRSANPNDPRPVRQVHGNDPEFMRFLGISSLSGKNRQKQFDNLYAAMRRLMPDLTPTELRRSLDRHAEHSTDRVRWRRHQREFPGLQANWITHQTPEDSTFYSRVDGGWRIMRHPTRGVPQNGVVDKGPRQYFQARGNNPTGGKTWWHYDAWLGDKPSRKVSNNTVISRDPSGNGDINIRYHRTDVVTAHPDGTYTLRHSGWHTQSTRTMIQDYSPARLGSEGGRLGDTGRLTIGHWRMEDGHRIAADGKSVLAYSPQWDVTHKLMQDAETGLPSAKAAFEAHLKTLKLPEPKNPFQAPEIDWRPDTTIPEDFYGASRAGRPRRYALNHEQRIAHDQMAREGYWNDDPAARGALADLLDEAGEPWSVIVKKFQPSHKILRTHKFVGNDESTDTAFPIDADGKRWFGLHAVKSRPAYDSFGEPHKPYAEYIVAKPGQRGGGHSPAFPEQGSVFSALLTHDEAKDLIARVENPEHRAALQAFYDQHLKPSEPKQMARAGRPRRYERPEEHDPFLRSIRLTGHGVKTGNRRWLWEHEQAPKLVYADWLGEQGNPIEDVVRWSSEPERREIGERVRMTGMFVGRSAAPKGNDNFTWFIGRGRFVRQHPSHPIWVMAARSERADAPNDRQVSFSSPITTQEASDLADRLDAHYGKHPIADDLRAEVARLRGRRKLARVPEAEVHPDIRGTRLATAMQHLQDDKHPQLRAIAHSILKGDHDDATFGAMRDALAEVDEQHPLLGYNWDRVARKIPLDREVRRIVRDAAGDKAFFDRYAIVRSNLFFSAFDALRGHHQPAMDAAVEPLRRLTTLHGYTADEVEESLHRNRAHAHDDYDRELGMGYVPDYKAKTPASGRPDATLGENKSVRYRRRYAFNPNEPRDDHGRWVVSAWASRAKEVGQKAMAPARAVARKLYSKMEARYGPRNAKRIARVMLAGVALPVPGAIVAAGAVLAPLVATAEIMHQFGAQQMSRPRRYAASDDPELIAAMRDAERSKPGRDLPGDPKPMPGAGKPYAAIYADSLEEQGRMAAAQTVRDHLAQGRSAYAVTGRYPGTYRVPGEWTVAAYRHGDDRPTPERLHVEISTPDPNHDRDVLIWYSELPYRAAVDRVMALRAQGARVHPSAYANIPDHEWAEDRPEQKARPRRYERGHPDFERALDENPADWNARLVYADWLDENGDSELADAQRWMAKYQKHPSFWAGRWRWYHTGGRWQENHASDGEGASAVIAKVGDPVSKVMTDNNNYLGYGDRMAAEHKLAGMLSEAKRQDEPERMARRKAKAGAT